MVEMITTGAKPHLDGAELDPGRDGSSAAPLQKFLRGVAAAQ
jgi:hypothetical protein